MSEEMAEKKEIQVSKFTLSTGKIVYIREPEIGDTEHAMKIAGKEAGPENEAYLSVLFQKEMVKVLLVQVDAKKLTLADKQQIKTLFTFREYTQVNKAVQAIDRDWET